MKTNLTRLLALLTLPASTFAQAPAPAPAPASIGKEAPAPRSAPEPAPARPDRAERVVSPTEARLHSADSAVEPAPDAGTPAKVNAKEPGTPKKVAKPKK